MKSEVRKACAVSGGQFDLIRDWKNAGLMPEWVRYEDPKPRSLLQWWGTDYRRAKTPDYWVDKLRKTLDAHDPEIALITDVRFPNEVEAIHAWGGYVVKCTRLGQPDVEVNEHPSESALDGYRGWDFYITADNAAEVKRQARDIGETVRARGLRQPHA